MPRVIRGYKYDHLLIVDGLAYPLMALRDAAAREIEAAGGTSSRDLPPFWKSFSPYADAILGIARRAGIEGTEPPDDMDISVVPSDGIEPYRASRKWAQVFNVDPSLHWFTSMQDQD